MRNLVLCTFLLGPAAMAMWMGPAGEVPVERLLRNEMEALRKNPKNAEAAYHLGRLHSYIFATRATKADMSDEGRAYFDAKADIRMKRTMSNPSPAEFQHLRYSINYRLATKLSGPGSLATLGLAWSLGEASHYGEAVGSMVWAGKPLSKREFAAKSAEAYRRVFDHNIKREQKMGRFDLGQANVSLSTDAFEGLARVDPSLLPAQKTALQKEIDKIPFGSIGETPIIFPLDRRAGLDSLPLPEAHVSFDLVGDGVKRSWSWVKPNVGILCWDPKRSGKITSGRQLFGPGTFWMMYTDGYAALAALDDDKSGWLTGGELRGIAVWIDRNTNGRSDRGEVLPVDRFGIVGIATRYSSREPVLKAKIGIRFRGGASAPSYDWIATAQLVEKR